MGAHLGQKLLLLAALAALGAAAPSCDHEVVVGAVRQQGIPKPREPAMLDGGDVVIAVRTDDAPHPISPWVYGVVQRDEIVDVGASMTRIAGPRWSTYNWTTNASNAGAADGAAFEYQNDGFLSRSTDPGAAVLDRLAAVAEQPRARGAVVQIPIGPFVAADRTQVGDVRDTGGDFRQRRFRSNRTEKRGGGFDLLPNGSEEIVYQDEFANFLKVKTEATVPELPVIVSLDDEPDLWRLRLEALFPSPLEYDEVSARNVASASAVKAVWPDVEIVGLGAFGWPGWKQRLIDPITGEPAPGSQGDFIDNYLVDVERAEEAEGRRLVDHVDIHWYSEAEGSSGERIIAHDDGTAWEARVQAPRSFHDGSYVEESWITRTATFGPIELLSKMLAGPAGRVTQYDKRVAIGAWDFGGGMHISGALAAVDAMGIFGVWEVSLAAMEKGHEPYRQAALDVFLEPDGEGRAFGGTSIGARHDDPARTSAYASLDEQQRPVIVVLNKTESVREAIVRIAHPAILGVASVRVLDGTTPDLRSVGTLEPEALNAYRYPMPPLSISVLAIAIDDGA